MGNHFVRIGCATAAVGALLLGNGCDPDHNDAQGIDVEVVGEDDPTQTGECEYPRSEPDAATFEFLTSSMWVGDGCAYVGDDLPPTCETIQLRADGTYAWGAESDYTERDDEGRWNFWSQGDRGLVFLDDGSALAFQRDGDALTLRNRVYERGLPNSGGGDASTLPVVAPSSLWCRMVANAWTKTNAFGLATVPDAVEFAADGTLRASYREGECGHGGTFSLYTEMVGTGAPTSPIERRLYLSPVSDPNTCDEREGGTEGRVAASNEHPHLEGDALVFTRASYYPDDGQARDELLSYDRYGNMVRTTVTTARFELGAEVSLAIAFENTAHRELTLEAFTVSVRDAAGTTELSRLELGSERLAHGGRADGALSVVLPPLPTDGTPATLEFATVFSNESGDRFDAAAVYSRN